MMKIFSMRLACGSAFRVATASLRDLAISTPSGMPSFLQGGVVARGKEKGR
jgi:hypothetical protein